MAINSKYTEEYCEYIVKTYGNTIYKVIYLYVKNKSDADDIFQQVFLTFVDKKPRLKNKNHEIGWLIKVAKNKSKDFLKSYWNKNTLPLEDEDSLVYIKNNEVLEAVYSLDEKYRIVIYMYYYEGYLTKEIGSILGIKDATIRTRLRRAREELGRLLKEGGTYEGKI